uniref:Coiled-coil domain-containing protein 13-like n=1 Tax=Phallusia mammillata TaxID=59560 RepID=A0A6F9D989_9ASCI|nr:coiled-coil domain-containing protein 13-like [Phallusia mammillata]
MDSDGLQRQFSALQEEQKRKLMMVKQRKSQPKSQDKMVEDSSFGISDDLSLSMADVMASSTVGLNVSLEAANTSMREELRELRDETGRLRKVMAEKEYEVKRLNRKLLKMDEEKRMLSEAGVASDAASSKIVDLSKKNRELTAVMESERSKCVRLQQKVTELEIKLHNSPKSSGDGDRKPAVRQSFAAGSPRMSNDELQEQLNAANLKVSDYRNQVQSLKQEMKVAVKVLSQETGDNAANIQQLLGNGAQGFRGRAQQVTALQDKVRDLEQKLKGSASPKEDKNMTRIRNMERMRKEQNDTLKEDLVKLQEQSHEFQRKWEASKARGKVLAGEVKSLKAQIGVLTDKGRHDNELITTLTKQQDRLQKVLERNATDRRETNQDEQQLIKTRHDLQQQESSQLAQMKRLLNDSEKRVMELESKIAEDLNGRSYDGGATFKPLSVFSPPSQRTHQGAPTQPTQSEITTTDNSENLMELRRKVVELEALLKASEIERQKLAELVAILNKRLQEAINKAETGRSDLHVEQRKCAALQQQLDTMGGSQRNDGGTSNRDTDFDGSADTLSAQLAIQMDENHALKEALESTLQGKQEDVALYNEMSDQTKHVFLDALRSFGSTSK